MKRPLGPVTGKPLVKCKYCDNWGQELPLPFGPQNICYSCGAKACAEMLSAPNPLFAALKNNAKEAK